ncbi:MAG: sigma-70 family RNA polymerase sigma factor [Phycisphaerales bacterium]|nr:sigma-70 family RNA polymerase sigma factor [Phycisphaerales bacterium]
MPQTTHAPPEPAAHAATAPDDTGALTHAIARGDTRAFGVLYQRWFDIAYTTARRLTGRDEAFCLDVVQDTMLKLARRVPRLDTEAALAAWLGRVTHRTALDRLRTERRRTARERSRETSRPATDAKTELEHQIRRLRAQLRALPTEDQSLLAARFARERTLAQAGEDHGLTGDAAHGRIRRALHALKHADETEGERTTP